MGSLGLRLRVPAFRIRTLALNSRSLGMEAKVNWLKITSVLFKGLVRDGVVDASVQIMK